MDELKFHKLITEHSAVKEFGWNGEMFLVFISYMYVADFMERLTNIFRYEIFEEDDFIAYMKDGYLVLDLCEVLENYADIEEVFPKDKYPH